MHSTVEPNNNSDDPKQNASRTLPICQKILSIQPTRATVRTGGLACNDHVVGHAVMPGGQLDFHTIRTTTVRRPVAAAASRATRSGVLVGRGHVDGSAAFWTSHVTSRQKRSYCRRRPASRPPCPSRPLHRPCSPTSDSDRLSGFRKSQCRDAPLLVRTIQSACA